MVLIKHIQGREGDYGIMFKQLAVQYHDFDDMLATREGSIGQQLWNIRDLCVMIWYAVYYGI